MTANREGDVEGGSQIIQPKSIFTVTGSSSIKPHTMAHHRRRGSAQISSAPGQAELPLFPDGFEETAIYGTFLRSHSCSLRPQMRMLLRLRIAKVTLKVVRRSSNPRVFLQSLDHPRSNRITWQTNIRRAPFKFLPRLLLASMDAHAAETANRQGDVESGPQIIQSQNVFTATGSSSKVVHNMPNQTYEGHRSNSFHAWSRGGSLRCRTFSKLRIAEVMLEVVRRSSNPTVFLLLLDHPQKKYTKYQTSRTKTTVQMPSATASMDAYAAESAYLQGDVGSSTQIIRSGRWLTGVTFAD
ncbi:hypothetical protein T10_5928 [Trichinella papuae]|uniref:Uncharacterized protein n=1 Tax=Trichinella papuae TaxID=268474 RepID=A0A0V1N0C8_9BILA|nr:hypothetical protein T10_5928 [Trichinella papuae]